MSHKKNSRESQMQQQGGKYFAYRPPPPHTHTHSLVDPRNEFKIQLSQNMVTLHIKSKGITNAATQ